MSTILASGTLARPRPLAREDSLLPRTALAATIAIVAVWALAPALGFIHSVMVLNLLGVALALVGLRRPELGMVGMGLLCTLDPLARQYLTSAQLWRWNALSFFLIGVALLFLSKLPGWLDASGALAAALALVIGIGMAYSPSAALGFQHLLGLLSYFGLVVYSHRAGPDGRVWYWTAVVSGTLGALGGGIYYLMEETLDSMNANAWAFFPVTALFLIRLGFPEAGTKGRPQAVLLALAIPNTLWVFLSGSRGGMALALVSLLSSLPRLRAQSTVAALAFAALATVAIGGLFAARQDVALGRIQRMFSSEYSMAQRTSGRSDLVRAGWYLFLDNPLLGAGSGGFEYQIARLDNVGGSSIYRIGQQVPAHSGWIKMLAENGIIGFLVLVAFVLSFAVLGFRLGGPARSLGLFATAVFAVALLSTEFQNKGLWLVASSVFVVGRPPGRRGESIAREAP